MEEINLSEWYNAQEAAQVLHTTAKYVRTLALQYGKIRSHKLSEHLMLYYKADVDAYQIKRGRPGRPRKAA